MTVIIRSNRVARGLLVGAACLTLLSFATQAYRLNRGWESTFGPVRIFNVDAEESVPTWFSAVCLLASSALLAVIAAHKHADKDRFATHWTVLSIIFLGLSMDEVASVHTFPSTPLRAVLNLGLKNALWVIPAALLVAGFAVAYGRFAAHLPATTRWRFVVAASLYVGGAIGMEAVGDYYEVLHGGPSLALEALITAEEFLEMVGIVVFFDALLSYARAHVDEVRLAIRD